MAIKVLVEPLGLEPKTSSMPWKRSSQLNYDPIDKLICFKKDNLQAKFFAPKS